MRTRLFEALSSLMQERGFDSLSLADIAAEAGIGRTAIYNHFPDKETLLVAYINHETAKHLATLESALHSVSEPLEKLRIYIRRHFQMKQFFHFSSGPSLNQVVSPETWAELRGHIGVVERHLHEILGEAIAAGDIPAQDIGTSTLLVHSIVTGRPAPATEPERGRFIESTELFVLRGLGARTTR